MKVMGWSIFRKVKAALDSEDIEGLHAVCCPSDEYTGEASLIADRIAKTTNFGQRRISIAEIEKIVSDAWNSQFGPFSDAQLEQRSRGFHAVAKKINE